MEFNGSTSRSVTRLMMVSWLSVSALSMGCDDSTPAVAGAAGTTGAAGNTGAAFAKLPAGTLDTLLKPENKAMLQAILKYHVVAGKVLAIQHINSTESAKNV